MQYGMIIDIDKCVGCHACSLACKAEWEVPTRFDRSWVHRLGPEMTSAGLAYTYYPALCNHCDIPVCVDVCPADPVRMTLKDSITGKTVLMEVAATWKDPFNGTVQNDVERCIGCEACVEACPYDVRYVNPDLADDKSKGKIDKCTLCVERVAEGLQPACVTTCLSHARIFGDLDDPDSEAAKYVKRGAEGLTSDAVQIGPNVLYYGTKEADMELLRAQAPQKMPEIIKRTMLTSFFKPAAKQITEESGLVAALLAKTFGDDNDR